MNPPSAVRRLSGVGASDASGPLEHRRNALAAADALRRQRIAPLLARQQRRRLARDARARGAQRMTLEPPPSTFTVAGSRPRSRMQARACEEKASLISTTSSWSTARPARASALRVAGIGPMRPMTRSTPTVAKLRTRASGDRPCRAAKSSLVTSTAAAPSVNGDEVPAVTTPSGQAGEAPPALPAWCRGGCGRRVDHLAIGQADRHDLRGQSPFVTRPGRLLVRLQRQRLLVGAAHLPALGHVLPAVSPIDR